MTAALARILGAVADRLEHPRQSVTVQHIHVDGVTREDVEAHVRRSLAYAKRRY